MTEENCKDWLEENLPCLRYNIGHKNCYKSDMSNCIWSYHTHHPMWFCKNFDLRVKSIHMYKNNSRETFSERKFLRAILRTYFPETLKKMLNIGRNWITLLSWFSDIYLDFYFHDKNVVIWIDNPTEFREIMIKGYRPQRFELFACGLSGYSEICVASFTCQVNTRKWEGKL